MATLYVQHEFRIKILGQVLIAVWILLLVFIVLLDKANTFTSNLTAYIGGFHISSWAFLSFSLFLEKFTQEKKKILNFLCTIKDK